jgi:hypothetical protein
LVLREVSVLLRTLSALMMATNKQAEMGPSQYAILKYSHCVDITIIYALLHRHTE